VTSTPGWARRLAKERAARGWSQAQAVSNLRATYERATGKSAGTQDSLIRQWKDWESGRVRPRFWSRYIAATFGTVTDDLFAEPADSATSDLLADSTGMDTAELILRLQSSSFDAATLRAVDVTIDRLNSEYRYRPAEALRAEGRSWLGRLSGLLDQRLSYSQHGQVLSAAARLALLVGCVEYDSGEKVAAETTRRFALDLATELDHRDVMGWAYEMAAWFALTEGDYNHVITASDLGMQIAGQRGVSVQLAAQTAKAWARLGNIRQAEVALDQGRTILESLTSPLNPDDHFVIDPTKWHFYAMDVYRIIGSDALAQVYAEETLRLGVDENGVERSPMRNAEARITLGVLAERAGEHDEALAQGFRALESARQSIPHLRMVASELTREFDRTGHGDDPDVQQFRRALATAPLRKVS
jgi:tetratricopeptide (TPR) repeat protein